MTMPLPKLMFYTHALVDGGGERLWACLATAFHRRGYPVVFVQDFAATDNQSHLDPAIAVRTLGTHPIAATRALTQVLREERPAVALSAIGGSNTKLMAALHLAQVPTKAIISYHGVNEWRTGLLSFATFAALPYLSARAARTVAVSAGLRSQLVDTWGAYAPKTVALHNPVFFPADAPVPTAQDLSARDDVVLAVGRFVAEKDFSTLIQAFARVKRQTARLVIIGKGPLQAQLEAQIAAAGLGDRVSLPGFAAPWPHYATAKVFVSSSRSEQFGNALVEAMAYGLPVVATDCNGPREILDNGRHGCIVPVGDPVRLADAIDQALDDPGTPTLRRARADAFSFAVRIPAYERLITDVLAEQPPRSRAVRPPDPAPTSTLVATPTNPRSVP
jgi:glycosyltransferase involved in cell wall biosynthesis